MQNIYKLNQAVAPCSWGVEPIHGKYIPNQHLKLTGGITVNGADSYARHGTEVFHGKQEFMTCYFLRAAEQHSNHFSFSFTIIVLDDKLRTKSAYSRNRFFYYE